MNARILWTYSSAYRVLGDTSYLRLATRAKDYILANFIDKQYGGAYFSLKADGTPSNTRQSTNTVGNSIRKIITAPTRSSKNYSSPAQSNGRPISISRPSSSGSRSFSSPSRGSSGSYSAPTGSGSRSVSSGSSSGSSVQSSSSSSSTSSGSSSGGGSRGTRK